MITLYDHIQELRAELRGCRFTRRERVAVEAELANAIAEQAELDRAFDAAPEALSDPTETIRGRWVSGPLPSSALSVPRLGWAGYPRLTGAAGPGRHTQMRPPTRLANVENTSVQPQPWLS